MRMNRIEYGFDRKRKQGYIEMNGWLRKDKYDGSIKIKLDGYVFHIMANNSSPLILF